MILKVEKFALITEINVHQVIVRIKEFEKEILPENIFYADKLIAFSKIKNSEWANVVKYINPVNGKFKLNINSKKRFKFEIDNTTKEKQISSL